MYLKLLQLFLPVEVPQRMPPISRPPQVACAGLNDHQILVRPPICSFVLVEGVLKAVQQERVVQVYLILLRIAPQISQKRGTTRRAIPIEKKIKIAGLQDCIRPRLCCVGEAT